MLDVFGEISSWLILLWPSSSSIPRSSSSSMSNSVSWPGAGPCQYALSSSSLQSNLQGCQPRELLPRWLCTGSDWWLLCFPPYLCCLRYPMLFRFKGLTCCIWKEILYIWISRDMPRICHSYFAQSFLVCWHLELRPIDDRSPLSRCCPLRWSQDFHDDMQHHCIQEVL